MSVLQQFTTFRQSPLKLNERFIRLKVTKNGTLLLTKSSNFQKIRKIYYMQEKAQNFDVVIIGGGAAGMSAALWCDDLKFSALMLEENTELGGQLLRVYNEIANYPGIFAADGRDLCGKFVRQLEDRSFISRLNCEISLIDFSEKRVLLNNGERFQARYLILATGVRRRKLAIAGEDEFKDRGILESGKKEGANIKGQQVVIVGGGDAALENSLILAETAARVYLVHRRAEFRGRSEFIARVRQNPQIEVLTETVVTGINGAKRVESVNLENLPNGRTNELKADCVLIRIGVQPNSEIAGGNLKLDQQGYIEVDRDCETSLKNIFAVGDVANPLSPTVSTAAGTGATAVKIISSRCQL